MEELSLTSLGTMTTSINGLLKGPGVYYIRNPDGTIVETLDVLAWAKYFEREDRIIKSHWFGDIHVSTVFLGLDHGFSLSDDPPLLFETMIFRGQLDEYQDRYATEAEAIKGHRAALRAITRCEDWEHVRDRDCSDED